MNHNKASSVVLNNALNKRLVDKRCQERRKGISWKTIRLSGLLTTEEMLYVLDGKNVTKPRSLKKRHLDEKNVTKPRSLKKRHLVARFKRNFRNHFLSSYLQYKDYVLFQSHLHLEKERVPTLEAFLLLDFHYIARTKKLDCSQ